MHRAERHRKALLEGDSLLAHTGVAGTKAIQPYIFNWLCFVQPLILVSKLTGAGCTDVSFRYHYGQLQQLTVKTFGIKSSCRQGDKVRQEVVFDPHYFHFTE